MSLAGLLSVIAADPQLQRALSQGDADTDLVAPPALRPFLAASIATSTGAADSATADSTTADSTTGDSTTGQPRFVLAVTATAREAENLTSSLGSLLPEGTVAYFPAWETLPHERLSPRSDTSGRRLAVLRRLAHPDSGSARSGAITVLVTPVRSLLQPMVSGLGDLEPVALRSGQAADFEEVIAHLVEIGYARTDLVEHRGEIAVRGGILDVFPPTEEHPLRVEFWGDTVEEIRYFRAADQRSLHAAAEGLWAPPCRELLLTPEVRERARRLAEDHPGLAEILGQLADGHRGRGHGGVRAGPGGPDGTPARPRPPGRPGAGLRSRADLGPGRRPGPDQPGIPGGLLGDRRRGRPGPHRPGCGRVPAAARGPGGRPAPGHRLVDGDPVQQC